MIHDVTESLMTIGVVLLSIAMVLGSFIFLIALAIDVAGSLRRGLAWLYLVCRDLARHGL